MHWQQTSCACERKHLSAHQRVCTDMLPRNVNSREIRENEQKEECKIPQFCHPEATTINTLGTI